LAAQRLERSRVECKAFSAQLAQPPLSLEAEVLFTQIPTNYRGQSRWSKRGDHFAFDGDQFLTAKFGERAQKRGINCLSLIGNTNARV
jgi:hypothetical protein